LREIDSAMAVCDSVSSVTDAVSAAEHHQELKSLHSEVVQVKTELDRHLTELSERGRNMKPVEDTATEIEEDVAKMLAPDAEDDVLSASGPQEHIECQVTSDDMISVSMLCCCAVV